MRTVYTLALVLALVLIVVGLAAVATVGPMLLAYAYGMLAAVAVVCGLELIGDVWAAV